MSVTDAGFVHNWRQFFQTTKNHIQRSVNIVSEINLEIFWYEFTFKNRFRHHFYKINLLPILKKLLQKIDFHHFPLFKIIAQIYLWERKLEISSFLQHFLIGLKSIYVYIVIIQLSFNVLTEHLHPCYSCKSNVCDFCKLTCFTSCMYLYLHCKHTYTLLRFSLSVLKQIRLALLFVDQ